MPFWSQYNMVHSPVGVPGSQNVHTYLHIIISNKPVVDPIATLAVPAGHRLVRTHFSVQIKLVDKAINKQPPVRFGTHVIGVYRWLPAEVNVCHERVKAMPWHASLVKGWSRLVLICSCVW
jgi:hypothetical protein